MNKITITTPSVQDERKRLGLFSISEAAREIGVAPQLVRYHQAVGNCRRPSIQIDGMSRRYYGKLEIEELRSFFEGRKPFERAFGPPR